MSNFCSAKKLVNVSVNPYVMLIRNFRMIENSGTQKYKLNEPTKARILYIGIYKLRDFQQK